MRPQRAKLRLRHIRPLLNFNLVCNRKELRAVYFRIGPSNMPRLDVAVPSFNVILRRIRPLLNINLECDRSELSAVYFCTGPP